MLQWLKDRGCQCWFKFGNPKNLIDKNIQIGNLASFPDGKNVQFVGTASAENQLGLSGPINIKGDLTYYAKGFYDTLAVNTTPLGSTIYNTIAYMLIPSGGPTIWLVNDGVGFAISDGSPGIVANTPVDLAITLSGSTVTFYVNGVKHGASKTISAAGRSTPNIIGRRGDNANRMTGGLEELIIFDQALSAEEIGQIYNGSYLNPYKNLVSRLSFDADAYDPVNLKYIEHPFGREWQIGDGATATTFPTKLEVKGANFDPSPREYLQTTNQENYPIGNNPHSIVAHFVYEGGSVLDYLFYYGTDSNNQETSLKVVSGQLQHSGYNNDISGPNLTAGEEYVVVYTYDGLNAGAHEGEKFYVNGKSVSIASVSGGGVFDVTKSTYASIGAKNYNTSLSGQTDGKIFDVQLHSKALNYSEVLAITNELKSKRGAIL